jgi:translation initiation factor 2B subunit (eIF-2B alpha/beta/delta family)
MAKSRTGKKPRKNKCDQILDTIRKQVTKKWHDFRTIENIDLYPYPSHDHNHCRSTEKVLDELIPEENWKKLDYFEIFLLKASIWLHDIGMQPKILDEDEKVNFSNPKKAQSYFQEIRGKHAQRSAIFIDERLKDLDLDDLGDAYIDILKKICLAHGHRAHQKLHQLKWIQDNIRIQLLIAYLRLADALHIPRAPDPRALKKFLSIGIDTVSRFHWLKSKYGNRIMCDPVNFKINFLLKHPKGIKKREMQHIVDLVVKTLQDELDSIKEILSKGGVSFYSTVDGSSKAVATMNVADADELQELLANLKLYDTKMTPSARAVIDSVFQQIIMFIGKNEDDVPPEQALEYLDEYLKKALNDVLRKRPCYVFLRRVFEFIETKIGSDESDMEKVRLIRQAIEKWSEERKAAIAQIPRVAYGVLADSAPVLLYGYSSSVVNCLKYYLETRKKDIDVYICEARTKTTYRFNNRLTYSDVIEYADKLVEAQKEVAKTVKPAPKFNITTLPDSAASNLFSRRKVSKVLLGANGISLSGRVGHTLGHLSIADMALAYNVPVFIIALSLKIGFFNENPKLKRENVWLTTDIDYEYRIKQWNNFNPREDIVPPEKIEAIITERGIIKPHEVYRYAKIDESDNVNA